MSGRAATRPRLSALGEAFGPGALAGPPICPPRRRPGESPIDLVVGLAVRAALAVQFLTWARANAQPVGDILNWRAWLAPDPGLIQAASVWTLGRIDPELTAFVLLGVAMIIALSLSMGLLARIAGIAVVLGAAWHITSVLPSAWPQAVAYASLGLYLALRGAGPASLDWALARLSRMG